METNIVLVGMPASGKTTVGNLLAQKLPYYTLIDTDSVIERTTGMLITEIFKKYSEDYFRKLEYDTIKMVANGINKIVSIGGGAFENPDNRSTLLHFGKVFYLKSDLDIFAWLFFISLAFSVFVQCILSYFVAIKKCVANRFEKKTLDFYKNVIFLM